MRVIFERKRSRRTRKRRDDCCLLCGFSDDDPALLGEKVKLEELKGSVHYFCLLTSCGVFQRGAADQGVFGFLIDDIKKERIRSSRLKCSVCRQKGAAVGCFVQRCKKKVHFPCGRRREFVSQFSCPFPSYCPDHAPTQTLSLGLDLSLPQTCSVCLDQIEPVLSYNILKCPSCHSSWFHRECVQRQAHSSGLFFFRCTLCNNKEQFQEEMQRMGIHVPERDASWELESGAYMELLEVYRRCDALSCVCPEGRMHSAKTGYLEIIRCRLCGSRGTHRKCSDVSLETKDWACPDCTQAIDGKPALMASPNLQRRSLSRRSLGTPPPAYTKRSSFPDASSPEASARDLLRALLPEPRPPPSRRRRLLRSSARLHPYHDQIRPSSVKLRRPDQVPSLGPRSPERGGGDCPLVEVVGDAALSAALELVRRRDFDPTRAFAVRFSRGRTPFPSSPGGGGEGSRRRFLQLLVQQIQDCEVFEGPRGCKNLALSAQALKEDLYFEVGLLVALVLVHGGPVLGFFSPALYQLLFNFPQNQALTPGHLTPGSPLCSTISRIQAADSLAELQSVLESCTDHMTLCGCNRPIRSLDDGAALVDDLIAFTLITRMQLPLQRFREGLQTLGVFEQVQLYPSVFLPLFTALEEERPTAETPDPGPALGPDSSPQTQETGPGLGPQSD